MGIEDIDWSKYNKTASQINEELIQRASAELAAQIDKDVLWSLYGREKYLYSCPATHGTAWVPDQDAWLLENVGKRYQQWEWHDNRFYFKHKEDLVFFLLKWS